MITKEQAMTNRYSNTYQLKIVVVILYAVGHLVNVKLGKQGRKNLNFP